MEPRPVQATRIINGIPAAPGLAYGRAVLWMEDNLITPRYIEIDSNGELKRLDEARAAARLELEEYRDKVSRETEAGAADIFSAHLMFLDDPALLKKARGSIEKNSLNAEASWMDAVESFAKQLESIPDPLLSARAVDIRDVGRRVLQHLVGTPASGLLLDSPAIVIARDLAPSQTASLEKDKVLAFCTAEGGPTSHTAILAKGLGLPAVVALGSEILSTPADAMLLVDGTDGEVVIHPEEQRVFAFQVLIDLENRRKTEAVESASQPAVTLDGRHVEVAANIGGLQDARSALAYGAEGIGLFRTEFLYLDRTSLPSEAEQVQVYRQVFETLGNRPIVVRTLDIGGDKAVSYLGIHQEANPFLGWRAIRMLDGRPDVFMSQLRALLQAGIGKDLRIMVPMVSNREEVLRARELLRQARYELAQEGKVQAESVQFGIMVEVPSAALISNQLAPELDFFSIGTNDLTQYTLAVDRTNARVAHLASPFHPAVLRLIQLTIQSAHAHQKWAGMCGEFAGEVIATPLLLGLGLDEFSMAPALIPAVKRAIRKCSLADCRQLSEQALALSTSSEVIDLLTKYAKEIGIQ